MAIAILAAFEKFPNEAAIIGRLQAGYTSLELSVLHCVQVVRDDFDTTIKVLFRTRGEKQRLDVADAMGRHFYGDHNLETEFSMAIGAMRHCMKIRNQYAHCIWWDDKTGALALANLEEVAMLNTYLTDLSDLTALHVDVPLLEQQEAYFGYALDLLRWVNYEGRTRAGTLPTQLFAKPKQIALPPLHIP
jgi:hypothetical protein